MKNSSRQIINDFIEKSDILHEQEFEKHVMENANGFNIQNKGTDGWDVEFNLPDNIKGWSALYTFRLFLQNNEEFSLKSINKICIDDELSKEFRTQLLSSLKEFSDLEKKHPVDIKEDFFEVDEHPTWYEIIQVVSNGNMGHKNNPEKRKKYEVWTRDDIRKFVLLQHFWNIVAEIIKIIYSISDLCKKEISLSHDNLGNENNKQ
jgi:hypothetical protein